VNPAESDADTPVEPLSTEELSDLARLLNRYGRDPAIRPNHAARALHVRAQVIEHGKAANPCPYTHAHTRGWCGYPFCRES
jgi:hypothetical protein